jgi:polysaccharide biosynthesis/export protein
MTMKPRSLLQVLTLIGLVAHSAAAQSPRTVAPAQPPRTAPAPAKPAPTPAQGTASTAPAPVGTTGTASVTNVVRSGIRPWNEQDYRLGPGDKLRVEVYGEPQLSQALQVRPDGKITLTLIGDVMAAGRTSLELRDALASALKSYVNGPAVTVIVQDALANQIDVVGEVASPGQQVLLGPVTILQAIARAGGLKEFAKAGSIYILRTDAKGLPQQYDAQYKEALKGKVAPVVLQPGDTVVVP